MDINQLQEQFSNTGSFSPYLTKEQKRLFFPSPVWIGFFFEKFYKLLLTLFIGIGSRHDELSGAIS